MNIYLSFFIGLLSGLICAHFAGKRGRSGQTWFLLGFFFGFLALLGLFLLPRIEAKATEGKSQISEEPPVMPAEPDPRLQEWFFLDQVRVQNGPVSFAELVAAWRKSRVTEKSYVWTEGMADWKSIEQLPLLLEKLK